MAAKTQHLGHIKLIHHSKSPLNFSTCQLNVEITIRYAKAASQLLGQAANSSPLRSFSISHADSQLHRLLVDKPAFRFGGITGATILGDGSLALILDPGALIDRARERS